jgi:hypothetical protein
MRREPGFESAARFAADRVEARGIPVPDVAALRPAARSAEEPPILSRAGSG